MNEKLQKLRKGRNNWRQLRKWRKSWRKCKTLKIGEY